MKKKIIFFYILALIFALLFICFTYLICNCDVKNIGVNGSNVGFSTINEQVRNAIKTNRIFCKISDFCGYVNFIVIAIFALLGLSQLIHRKNIFKVDIDILCLGLYYIIILSFYFIFNQLNINLRPFEAEASYPSSHTLLSITIMITTITQIRHRVKNLTIRKVLIINCYLFMFVSVLSRFLSGVHWFTDFIGSFIVSTAFNIAYFTTMLLIDYKKNKINKNI